MCSGRARQRKLGDISVEVPEVALSVLEMDGGCLAQHVRGLQIGIGAEKLEVVTEQAPQLLVRRHGPEDQRFTRGRRIERDGSLAENQRGIHWTRARLLASLRGVET